MATLYPILYPGAPQDCPSPLVRPRAAGRFWAKVSICAHTLRPLLEHRHTHFCDTQRGRWCQELLRQLYAAPACDTCCWPWQGYCPPDGYGRTSYRFADGSREYYAHRIAWRLHAHVPFPPETESCHQCHLPPCCNPAHIRPDTHQVNLTERQTQGSVIVPRGVQRPNAKLTVETVQHIWFLHIIKRDTQRQIAAQLGVSQVCICHILARKTWNHVPIPDFAGSE